ncbi:MBL fold metallo-hydrolase [Lysinibacillus telephonicus]|uniref:MBL fold metallo-hydrolase n=3 Tax=Lysinibacillus telephonicus TaxID=1714840 RepID=A0A3S0JGG8_9BACI|nr:MBL fold metallo-hydrolase [Lysinibacillus telephonicus]RTQ87326.1 MBL fold metallo-hydrolase [Lysinibacillus telephonicus]
MLLKKSIELGSVNGISYANWLVTFKNISLNVYCFAVDGVLIDTGSRSLKKQFQPFLLESDIDQVVITHIHEDHSGGASVIKEHRNVPIYIHEMSVKECETNPDYPLYRKVFWGKRKPFQAKPIGKSFSSRNSVWEVIETPGHAKDHLAFLNQQTGQLFSGDLFVQQKTKVILRDESIPTIIQSIKRLLTYNFEELYCSHAGFVKDGRGMLENKLEYLLELQHKVLTLYKEGNSVQQIQGQLFKRKYPITNLSFGEWDSIHIITSILKDIKQLI